MRERPHCASDNDQLFDLTADPNEPVDLAADPAHAEVVRGLRAEVDRRWGLEALRLQVLEDQGRRRFLMRALRAGRVTPWDFTPPCDATQEYVRTRLDGVPFYDVGRRARWPR